MENKRTNNAIMILFKKQRTTKEGKKFDTYFLQYPDRKTNISCNLTKEFQLRMMGAGVQFPARIELSDKDYFLTTETFENSQGEKQKKYVVVLTSFTSCVHEEIEKQTLEDLYQILNPTKEIEELPF